MKNKKEQKQDFAENLEKYIDNPHEDIKKDSQGMKKSSLHNHPLVRADGHGKVLNELEEMKKDRIHPSLPTPEEIIYALKNKNPQANADVVGRAYRYAEAAHAGQLRLSGEPYLMHPASVALILAQLGFDEFAVSAGLLHDTVEDTEAYIEELDSEFGEEVADIVDGVTKISVMSFDSKEEQQAENIRKMILAMSHDIRVPIVKLADRMHNMRTLDFQKPHKQMAIAQETMDIYAPLANRLGLHRFKLQLEDLSFKYLYPDAWKTITEWLDENQMEERQLIEKVITKLQTILDENKIDGHVFGRIKHKYSIYKKMTEQKTTLDEMHDIIAFRVLVNDVRDCYAVLGFVHSLWKPVPGRFKDYVSVPKQNGYQSLHSTVIGPEGERLEVQIRTFEMHNLAEHGVASHWLYKERSRNIKDAPQFQWIRDLLERQRDEADSKEFMHSLKLDLFKDEVFVFTPKGQVKELPEGSTAIDYAYLIHTDIGHHCVGAKVDGKLTPLSTPLKSGSTIEIIIDKNRNPSRDWLKFVKTSKARSRIQHYLNTKERAASLALGKEILEKEGRKMGVNLNKVIKDGTFALLIDEFSLNSIDDILISVGYTRLTPKKVLSRYLEVTGKNKPTEDHVVEPKPSREEVESRTKTNQKQAIIIQGQDDMLVRFAQCCSPLPGDSVVGFISRGRGIIVHTLSCPHIRELEAERLITVAWSDQELSTKPMPARVHIFCKNEKGTLASIATVFMEQDVNIDSLAVYTQIDGKADIDATIEVRDVVHLYQTFDKLRKLEPVIEVTRTTEDSTEYM